jgi:hypothetical protein
MRVIIQQACPVQSLAGVVQGRLRLATQAHRAPRRVFTRAERLAAGVGDNGDAAEVRRVQVAYAAPIALSDHLPIEGV